MNQTIILGGNEYGTPTIYSVGGRKNVNGTTFPTVGGHYSQTGGCSCDIIGGNIISDFFDKITSTVGINTHKKTLKKR